MTALIIFVLPLVIGLMLSFVIGPRAKLAAKKSKRHRLPWFVRYVLGSGALVLVISIILAFLFADAMDTLDGQTSPSEFVGYVFFQVVCMSAFLVPTLAVTFFLGRQRTFE